MKVYSIVEKSSKKRAEVILSVDMPKLSVTVRTWNKIVLKAPRSIYEAWSDIIADNVKLLPSMVCSWNSSDSTLTIECNSNDYILELFNVINGIALHLTRVIRESAGYEAVERDNMGNPKRLRTSQNPVDIIDRKEE